MADNKQDKGLLALIGKLPEELQEEGSTGRDLIDSIICEAEGQERRRIKKQLAVVEMPNLPHKETGYNVDGIQYVALAMSLENWQALKGGNNARI